MTGLSNGVGEYLARPRSIRDCEDELSLLGYDGIEFFPAGRREFGARTFGTFGRVEAIGKTKEHAAQQLVRAIKRP